MRSIVLRGLSLRRTKSEAMHVLRNTRPFSLAVLVVLAFFLVGCGRSPAAKDDAGASSHAPIVSSEFVALSPPTVSSHASTLAQAADGDLVASWFGGTAEQAPDVVIWVARKHDGRWGEPALVARGGNAAAPLPTWNPVLFQSRNGRLDLYYKVGPAPASWWGMRVSSTDGGRTWSAPHALPAGVMGPVKNPIVEVGRTELVPSSTEAGSWHLQFERSVDGGRSWAVTSLASPGIEAIQPVLYPAEGSNVFALARTKQGHVARSDSKDGGATWGALRLLTWPNPNAGISGLRLIDGRYLLVSNPQGTDGSPPLGRGKLTLALSTDGNRWRNVLTLEDDPGHEYSYPYVIQTRDHMIHVTYTWRREKIRHVVINPAALN